MNGRRDDEPESMRGIIDRFTRVDNLIDELVGSVKQLRQSVQELPDKISLQADIQQMVIQRQFAEADVYSFTPEDGVSANDSESVTRSMPFTGTINEVIVGFPDGSGEEVGINLIDKPDGVNERFFPSNPETEVIVGNNIYHPFSLSWDVNQGDKIEANFFNESSEARFPTLIITIVREADVEVLS